jgi:hypothetical protein
MKPDHPQRIILPWPRGSLLKRVQPRAPRVNATKDDAYLAMVRQCPCLDCAQDPAGEACHLRMSSATHGKKGGMGKKPDDKWVLPLCREHHERQHKIGERQFWYELGINPFLAAKRLYAKRGDLVAMRAVVYHTIAERESRQQILTKGATNEQP